MLLVLFINHSYTKTCVVQFNLFVCLFVCVWLSSCVSLLNWAAFLKRLSWYQRFTLLTKKGEKQTRSNARTALLQRMCGSVVQTTVVEEQTDAEHQHFKAPASLLSCPLCSIRKCSESRAASAGSVCVCAESYRVNLNSSRKFLR